MTLITKRKINKINDVFFFDFSSSGLQHTTKLRQLEPKNTEQTSREKTILTWKASKDFATRERGVHKQPDNSFRDGFAHESAEITDNG